MARINIPKKAGKSKAVTVSLKPHQQAMLRAMGGSPWLQAVIEEEYQLAHPPPAPKDSLFAKFARQRPLQGTTEQTIKFRRHIPFNIEGEKK
jgi:hypothetical protein